MAKISELVKAAERRRSLQSAARKAKPAKKTLVKKKTKIVPVPAPKPEPEPVAVVEPPKVPTLAELSRAAVNVELIGPDEALSILEQYNTHNRPVTDSRVEAYQRAMEAGEWRINNDMLVFSWPVNGQPFLLNGQHRLWAVFKSGTSQPFMVMRGADPAWQEVMDTGYVRKQHERWGLRGDMGKVSRREVSVSKALAGERGKRFTNEEAREFFERHRTACHFACTNIKAGVRGISNTAVLSVVARGYYHLAVSELERFCRVLVANIPEGEGCTPIFMLRKHLTDKAGMGGRGWSDSYQRAERALKAFQNGEAPAKLYAAEREIFPLPEEKTPGPVPQGQPR